MAARLTHRASPRSTTRPRPGDFPQTERATHLSEQPHAAQYRQGDVLLVRVEENVLARPHRSVGRDRGRIVLAYGEATGHAHAIADADAELIELETGERFLVTARGVSLRHEEHAAVELPPGAYRVVRQREYVPAGAADDEEEEADEAPDSRYVED